MNSQIKYPNTKSRSSYFLARIPNPKNSYSNQVEFKKSKSDKFFKLTSYIEPINPISSKISGLKIEFPDTSDCPTEMNIQKRKSQPSHDFR